MWCTDTFKFHLWNQNADHIMQVTEDHLLKILTNLYGLQSSWDRLNFRRLNCSGMFLESHIFADMSSHRFLEIICKTRTNKDALVILGDGIVLTNKRLIMIKHLHMLCTASKISVQWEQKLLAYNEWLYKMGQKEQYLHVHKTMLTTHGYFRDTQHKTVNYNYEYSSQVRSWIGIITIFCPHWCKCRQWRLYPNFGKYKQISEVHSSQTNRNLMISFVT